MMSSGIAGRIGFRFHDASAEAAGREIVNDDSPDEEASEIDCVRWKLGAAKAASIDSCRRGFRDRARRGHRMQSHRDSSFCRSSEETRS